MEKTKGILTIFFKDAPSDEVDAILEIDDKSLQLIFKYEYDENWTGKNIGPDLYQMNCHETDGTGEFIYRKDLKTLFGLWKEPGGEGMLSFRSNKFGEFNSQDKNADKN